MISSRVRAGAALTQVGFLEASSSVVECGFIQHAGEGDGVGKGKKDTGYLYKAFMVARPAYLLKQAYPASQAP